MIKYLKYIYQNVTKNLIRNPNKYLKELHLIIKTSDLKQ